MRLKRNKRKIGLYLLLVFPVVFFFLFAVAPGESGSALAQKKSPVKYIDLQVPVPGLGGKTTGFPQYLMYMYKFLVGSIGLIAVVMIMVGGFKWILAAGNSSRIEDAKTTIFSAVAGLLIALGSYTILNLINPNLTNLKVTALPSVTGEEIKYDFTDRCSFKPKGSVFRDEEGNVVDRKDLKCGVGYEVSYIKDASGKKEVIKESCFGEGGCASGNCIPTGEIAYKEYDDITSSSGYFGNPTVSKKRFAICADEIGKICRFGTSSLQSCKELDKIFVQLNLDSVCYQYGQTNDGKYLCGSASKKRCRIATDEQKKCNMCSGLPSQKGSTCVDPRTGVAVFTYSEENKDNYPERVKGNTICCGRADKQEIDCRPKSRGCNSDEVSLTPNECWVYSQDPKKKFQTRQGGGDKRYCDAFGNEVCCMQVYYR